MTKKIRNSNIELLKIIGIFFIIVSHITQTIGSNSIYFNEYAEPIYDLTRCFVDIKSFILVLLRYLGGVGNMIFLVSSAWFLSDSNKSNKEKIIKMILDVFIVSLFFLICIKINGIYITFDSFIRSILPTFYCNNWFVSAYICLYLVHPLLDKMIDAFSFVKYTGILLFSVSIYWVLTIFMGTHLFSTNLLDFILVYLITIYFKKYLISKINNVSYNIRMLIIGVVLLVIFLFLSQYLINYFNLYEDEIMRLGSAHSPLIFVVGFSLFNLFRQTEFTNKTINYISSLSLLIYITHENILIRTYIRPIILGKIINQFGWNNVLIIIFIISLIVFAVSVVTSIVYKETLGRITVKISKIIKEKTEYLIKNISKAIVKER